MTSRERVIAAIEFTGPDRVPFRHCVLPASYRAHPRLAELLGRHPSDFEGEDGRPPAALPRQYRAGQYVDEWQCVWTVLREGYIGQVTEYPLRDLDRLPGYRLPEPPSAPERGAARQMPPAPDERYRCRGSMTLFERMVDLCGFENLLAELAAGNPRVPQLRDRIVAYNIACVQGLLSDDVDGVYFADDWGTQRSLMISPDTWREVFLPAYRRQFAPVREAGKHVFFHTDGYTLPILPDLADAGVNVFWTDLTLNPLDRLRSILGGRVCFQALTDVQFVLRGGTPAAVRQHGRDIIAALGSFNGGLIGCSEVGADQPWQNVVAIFRTFHDDGHYPLKLRWTAEGGRYHAQQTGA
jgi:uroporphyrinogen decarboxylase